MDNCNCGFGAIVPKFGTPGATFIPHVTESADAVELGWTNNRGLPNPDPVKIPKGGSNSSGGNVDLTGVVKSVNGQTPDENGNVEIETSGSIVFDYLTEEVEGEIPCTGITLNKSSLTFNGTGQQTIIATVTPSDTTDTLTWASNNPGVAAVSGGVVTAYTNGSATITARCGDYSASCAVEVSGVSGSDTVAVTGITLDQSTASVQVDSTVTLTATVKPDNATNKTVLWSSDNETVATVVDGVVTGVSEGTATIGAMTADGGFSAVCNVTVAAASNYKNLFDMNTMVGEEGIAGNGTVSTQYAAWKLARVPVKENTKYSLKKGADTNDTRLYTGAHAGAIGFADQTGATISPHLGLTTIASEIETNINGVNALLSDYAHMSGENYEWVTFTTPAGCAYLLFNTALVCTADAIQLEEGDTIHNYYLPYVGGES